MTYIIHGATGAQGSPVLNLLQQAGHEAVAAVRDPSGLPAAAASVAVDLSDAAALAEAYRGADGVFVHLPMGAPADGRGQAAAIAAAVAEARPARVVISTSGQIVDAPESPLQAAPDSAIMTLIDSVTATGVSTAVVAPRLYLENLLLPVVLGPARGEGVLRYPLPESFPVSWSSHLDVADVVVRLLLDASVTGTVAVGHRPGLVGADLAGAFSTGLGKAVGYEGISPTAFGALIAPMFGPAAAPVVGLYQALNATDGNVIGENNAQALLELAPRPVSQWLADLGI
ncbi:NmrA family NAD(P)-binding protein [Microbacterium sp. 22195]|uniref:NmrA family NAD(P)-binding protein n=1 Tax=Microbacterium sp. 22195 TaxID=3453891 RepID=UPI003F86A3C0